MSHYGIRAIDWSRRSYVGTDEAGWMTGAPWIVGGDMDERERLVIRYAHLGSGRNPRNHEILTNRQIAQGHIAEIQAEQERKNADLPNLTGEPMLQLASR